MNNLDPKIIVALDLKDKQSAIRLANLLNPNICRLKVGLELFTICGPKIIEEIHKLGFQVFLDLKYHDIPNQVANACIAAANLGVWMCNVHASGGINMMESAANAVANLRQKPKLIAVTMLTSLNDLDLHNLNFKDDIITNVLRLAKLTKNCGLDGVVCSAIEAKIIRQEIAKDFILVTPGIRQKSSSNQDQKRVVTPNNAIANGSSYLVIGRDITGSKNPVVSLEEIHNSITKKQQKELTC